jgi:hypothetical protein
VTPGYAECLPPLNADFFTQLQRIRRAKHADLVAGVIDDAVKLFGSDFSLTLEDYFTGLESMLGAAERSYSTDRALAPSEIAAKRTRLLNALAAVLEESADVTRHSPQTGEALRPCSYHAGIVEALHANDTIITFNYDCVIDHALRQGGRGKWSAQYGYGFPRPSRVQGYQTWSAPDPPRGVNTSINLLKLHGSVNWFPLPVDEEEKVTPSVPIRLRQRTYRQRGDNRFEIVPPEFVKRVDSKPALSTIWRNAELAVRRARVLAFVGFSFTPTDLHAESTFRLALYANSSLERVVIANPNPDHRRKIRSVLADRLRSSRALVTQYDTLKDLAVDLPGVLA